MSKIIYLFGTYWMLFTAADGIYFLHMEQEDGTRVRIEIPETLALQIQDLFVSVETMRHEKKIKELTDEQK